MQEEVKKVLDELRGFLVADGGDVELLEITDGIVKIRLIGACGDCPMSTMTLKNVIERVLKEQVPAVKEVIAA